MDLGISFLKGLKTLGVVLASMVLASIASSLTGVEVTAALQALAEPLKSVPFVGAALYATVSGLVLAGVAALVEAIRNAIKHLNPDA